MLSPSRLAHHFFLFMLLAEIVLFKLGFIVHGNIAVGTVVAAAGSSVDGVVGPGYSLSQYFTPRLLLQLLHHRLLELHPFLNGLEIIVIHAAHTLTHLFLVVLAVEMHIQLFLGRGPHLTNITVERVGSLYLLCLRRWRRRGKLGGSCRLLPLLGLLVEGRLYDLPRCLLKVVLPGQMLLQAGGRGKLEITDSTFVLQHPWKLAISIHLLRNLGLTEPGLHEEPAHMLVVDFTLIVHLGLGGGAEAGGAQITVQGLASLHQLLRHNRVPELGPGHVVHGGVAAKQLVGKTFSFDATETSPNGFIFTLIYRCNECLVLLLLVLL